MKVCRQVGERLTFPYVVEERARYVGVFSRILKRIQSYFMWVIISSILAFFPREPSSSGISSRVGVLRYAILLEAEQPEQASAMDLAVCSRGGSEHFVRVPAALDVCLQLVAGIICSLTVVGDGRMRRNEFD